MPRGATANTSDFGSDDARSIRAGATKAVIIRKVGIKRYVTGPERSDAQKAQTNPRGAKVGAAVRFRAGIQYEQKA